MTEDQREIRRKKRVLEYAEKIEHVGRACRRFGSAALGNGADATGDFTTALLLSLGLTGLSWKGRRSLRS